MPDRVDHDGSAVSDQAAQELVGGDAGLARSQGQPLQLLRAEVQLDRVPLFLEREQGVVCTCRARERLALFDACCAPDVTRARLRCWRRDAVARSAGPAGAGGNRRSSLVGLRCSAGTRIRGLVENVTDVAAHPFEAVLPTGYGRVDLL